jgi:hypothetical protein
VNGQARVYSLFFFPVPFGLPTGFLATTVVAGTSFEASGLRLVLAGASLGEAGLAMGVLSAAFEAGLAAGLAASLAAFAAEALIKAALAALASSASF